MLKDKIKKISFVRHLNEFIKAYQQEHKSKIEKRYYQVQAKTRNIVYLEENFLEEAVNQRLKSRGVKRPVKPNGELHIFLAYSISNWESILPAALKPFGKVTEFDWRKKGFDERSADWVTHREKMNAEMLQAYFEAHNVQPIDAVVGYLSGQNTSPEILRIMANAGSVIFNFCWDDKLSFRGRKLGGRWTGVATIASAVDLNLTNAPDSIVKYAGEGGIAMFWPEGAHPDVHKPYDIPFEYDVSFVGQKYGWRPRFIKKLRKYGVNVATFGYGWENDPLSVEEMVKLYSKSRINLGFSGVGFSKKLMCLKGRDFEVPMSGGLYLTQDNPELALVYKVGEEIVTYRDEKDCAEKIKWLLADHKKADDIRKAGREKALGQHTWSKRFEQIFVLSRILDTKQIAR